MVVSAALSSDAAGELSFAAGGVLLLAAWMMTAMRIIKDPRPGLYYNGSSGNRVGGFEGS